MRIPLVIAHRGDVQNAPENTLPALESAIRLGADGLEFDVYATRDGHLIVHHDYYLGRTVDAEGYIGDWTIAELRRLDAGSRFGEALTGVAMPTLAEVLDLGRGRVRFEIQVCGSSLGCLRAAIEEIHRFGVEDDVELTSEHVPLLCRAKEINPKLRTGLFFSDFPEWMQPALRQRLVTDWLIAAGAQVAHLAAPLQKQGLVDGLPDAGFLVHGGNLNTEEAIRQGLALGLDQFTTNHLDLALLLRQETFRSH